MQFQVILDSVEAVSGIEMYPNKEICDLPKIIGAVFPFPRDVIKPIKYWL